MPAGPEAYRTAVEIIRAGGLVALPTETVYGLAGDAAQDVSVARIYAAKGRPAHNPLIAHVLTPKRAHNLAYVPPLAKSLMDAFWPGPLTLVLDRRDDANISRYATAGLGTIAVRCPKTVWSDAFRAHGFDGALVMPSANISGHISPTLASHVAADLGDKVDLIIDDGPCNIGVESTVLRVDGDSAHMLRAGGLSLADLQRFDPRISGPKAEDDIIAPGMLKSHYAPKARLRMNVTAPESGEHHLGFGPCFTAPGLNLSETGDLNIAARNLFDYLRRLDTVSSIAVAPIPLNGIGAAINDRLSRAAADRD